MRSKRKFYATLCFNLNQSYEIKLPSQAFLKVSQWRKIMIIFEWFIVLMWKYLNFQLFCFCYSVVNVGSAFTEAQPGSSLTALCFEIVCSLLRKIVERGFQILTLMNFHEPLEIKCNFQQPSSSYSPLQWIHIWDPRTSAWPARGQRA